MRKRVLHQVLYIGPCMLGILLSFFSEFAQAVDNNVLDEDKVPTIGEIYKACEDCPEMLFIPKGKFLMGCLAGRSCSEHELPVHLVKVPGFYMQIHEVTFEEWDACIWDGGCRHRPEDEGHGRGKRPVTNIDYFHIISEYLPWLNKRTGKNYRLPSEAEWEYAARAGSETRFSWGDEFSCKNAQSLYCGSIHHGPLEVKSFKPNAWGLYGFHGNVSELVEDCWDYDAYDSVDHGAGGQPWKIIGDWELSLSMIGRIMGVTCPAGRVLRGGSWQTMPLESRSANRQQTFNSGSADRGFRLALDVSAKNGNEEKKMTMELLYSYLERIRDLIK